MNLKSQKTPHMPFIHKFFAPAVRPLLIGCAMWALCGTTHSKRPQAVKQEAQEVSSYGQREAVENFCIEIAHRHQLDLLSVQQQLAQARYQPSVVKYIMPPPAGGAKNWAAYRARFVEPVRLRAGLAFWRDNEALLAQAEQTYGVPAEVVVGIIGVETIYGQQMGSFRVIDALTTLAFDFPVGRKDRSAFFRDELEQLFVLAQRSGRDPSSFYGSYAGAMGLGQFMPSSWNKYAVDFDGDGQIDMHNSPADAIGSVANYLAAFGWKRGQPARFEVAAPIEIADRAALMAADITPTFTPQQFAERGAALASNAQGFEGLLAFIELQNGKAAPSFVAGTSNFYTVTRYNWSSYYAMAVLDLGEEVARIYRKIR
jgi:membrane-bound lytic murein transglycosylase B